MKQVIMDKKEMIAQIAKKYELMLVLLFGSQVSGKIHGDSDIDIAIYGKKLFRPMEIAEIQFDISCILKFEKVEIVDIKTAPPLLLKELADNSLLLYQIDNTIYDEMKIYFIKRYIEAKPLLKFRVEQFEASLKTS